MTFEGENGVLATLRQNYQELHGVHRLDKETSGLMLFAKTKACQKDISELFAQQNVSKTYLALSLRRPSKKMGTLKGDLEKGRGGSYRLLRSTKNPAITSFKSYFIEENSLRVFILKPKTGKTHQLRVHLKSIGSPVLGDTRYGNDSADRMYLACIRLVFTYKDEKFNFLHFPEVGEYYLKHNFREYLG